MQTTSPEDTAAVLAAAADHIEQRGWLQGASVDLAQRDRGIPANECRVCAVGALNVVIAGHPEGAWTTGPEGDRLAAALTATTRHLGIDLVKLNDRPGTTAADVTAALRATAARLRAGDPGLTA